MTPRSRRSPSRTRGRSLALTERAAWVPSHHGRILPLRSVAAQPVSRVGGKAAGLARARSAGLPVLDGWVVPSEAASGARAAAAGYAQTGRTAQAALAVMATELDPALRASLERAAGLLGGSLIVRSSTPLDDDPRWSGAFGSYLDVAQGDVATAMLGCWASLFSRDVTERAAACGVPVPELPLTVLVQPMMRFTAGGVAQLLPDGSVHGSVIEGGPGRLLSGRAGGRDFVVGGGTGLGGPAQAGQQEHNEGQPRRDGGRLAAVAALSRQVYRQTGSDHIEWGWLDGKAVLLQCRTVVPDPPGAAAGAHGHGAVLAGAAGLIPAKPRLAAAAGGAVPGGATPEGDGHPLSPAAAWSARRLAALAARCPGRLADELILPWAVACADLPGDWMTRPDALAAGPDAPTRGGQAGKGPTASRAAGSSPTGSSSTGNGPTGNGTADEAATDVLGVLCAELTAAAWARPAAAAMAEATATLRLLRAGLHPGALERLAALRPVDQRTAHEVLALIAGLGAELQRLGYSSRAAEVWRYRLADVRRMLAGTPAPRPLGPPMAPQWDGFLIAACTALGTRRTGTAAAPGVATGAPLFVAARGEIHAPTARRVLVVARPLPVFAPLLWGAAGLVSESGSPGAHLFDVARSLGVPAVADCPLGGAAERMADAVTVDGGGGAVFALAGDAQQAPGPGAERWEPRGREPRERAS
jgi:phosphohistidine swiveling domain-containing protein